MPCRPVIGIALLLRRFAYSNFRPFFTSDHLRRTSARQQTGLQWQDVRLR
ncbi:MAG: hypothetical protein OXF74_03580 [Rhodobacteraceae bacterium]|nr:hypothetical protein [Paracoccaceae bacterium]